MSSSAFKYMSSSEVNTFNNIVINNNNRGEAMKDQLTFNNEISTISSDTNLSFEVVEDLALSLIKEQVLDDMFFEQMNLLFGNSLDYLFGITEGDYDYDVLSDEEYNPASIGSIMSDSIYNLDDEDDLKSRMRREQAWLDGESSSIEKLAALELEAISAFQSPKAYPLKEDRSQFVTGFIGLYTHCFETKEGLTIDVFKSTGDKITVPLGDIEDIDKIAATMLSQKYYLSDLVQVKFYSPLLSEVVGSRSYNDGERKELVKHSDEYSTILYAIPDCDALTKFSPDDSIYQVLNKVLQEEVLYGRTAEEILGKHGFSSWAAGKEFYDIRLPEIKQEEQEYYYAQKSNIMVKHNHKFKSDFSNSISDIENLNSGSLSIMDLMRSSDPRRIRRILYVAKSKSFSQRIKSKSVYVQIIALDRRLSQSQKITLQKENEAQNKPSAILGVIESINAGKLKANDLCDSDVSEVMKLLWDSSRPDIKIGRDQVKVYFDLKERYLNQMASEKAAA